MGQPLVSVVTITRNRGTLLRRCIASVLGQTYINIEHIIVDGASDDNTDEVISEFNDERLKFFKLDYNWPIKDTQTFAFDRCQGKYITFLDSDDEYLPEKIEKQVALLEHLPQDYGFVYCWMTYFDGSNNNAYNRIHNPQLRGFVGDEVVERPIITGTPTLMFRMSFWKDFDGWKDPQEIGIASDWEMCARACQKTKVDFVPESLVKIYINHGLLRQSESSKYYEHLQKRTIVFHEHFLKQFADVFERHPQYAGYHYINLFQCYAALGVRKEAWRYCKLYLSSKPSLSLRGVFSLIKNLIKMYL